MLQVVALNLAFGQVEYTIGASSDSFMPTQRTLTAGDGTEASMLYLPSPVASWGWGMPFLSSIAAAGIPPWGKAMVMLLTMRPYCLDKSVMSWISIQLPVTVVLSQIEPVGFGRLAN